MVGALGERGEQQLLFRTRQPDGAVVAEHLDRSQNSQLDAARAFVEPHYSDATGRDATLITKRTPRTGSQ